VGWRYGSGDLWRTNKRFKKNAIAAIVVACSSFASMRYVQPPASRRPVTRRWPFIVSEHPKKTIQVSERRAN